MCLTVMFDRNSGDYVVPFEDDNIRNAIYLRRRRFEGRSSREIDSTKADQGNSNEDKARFQQDYTNQVMLWMANANSIVVRFLLKLLSNMCAGGGSTAQIDAVKAGLRKLVKSDDTSAVFGAMLESSDVLAFYFSLIIQQPTASVVERTDV